MSDAPERICAWFSPMSRTSGYWGTGAPLTPNHWGYIRADLYEAQAAEIKELQSHLESLQNRYAQATGEIERLREALEQIAMAENYIDQDGLWSEKPGHSAEYMWLTASAALQDTKQGAEQ